VLLSSIFRKCLANVLCKNEYEKEDTHVTVIDIQALPVSYSHMTLSTDCL